MAHAVHVAGKALVKVGTGAAGVLEELGYTRNGVDIRCEGFFLNVPGDENGGEHGPPIDVQIFGEIAHVRLELTKWTVVVADEIASRTKDGTAGTPPTPGTLMFAGSKAIRLLVATATTPMNFLRAFPRGAIEINKGTRYSALVCEFECHKNAAGLLYNAVTT